MTTDAVTMDDITIEQRATAACPPALLDGLRQLLDRSFTVFDDHHWHHATGGVHLLARQADGGLIGHAALVPRRVLLGDRAVRSGYVEAVATAPEARGLGIGSQLMGGIAELVRQRYELGVLCTGVHAFYERLGWERWTGPTHVRHGDLVVRTPDSDGTVMVLRHGPTATVTLAQSITCDTRPGDDW